MVTTTPRMPLMTSAGSSQQDPGQLQIRLTDPRIRSHDRPTQEIPVCRDRTEPSPPGATCSTRSSSSVRSLFRTLGLVGMVCNGSAIGQPTAPRESDYYEVTPLPTPDHVSLEVGGLARDEDTVYVATRRGEIWTIRDAWGPKPRFERFADGLQEPLGLLLHDGWIYSAQRGELTRMQDRDGDGKADRFETVCDDWNISGSYHEYAFGPRLDPSGNLWVTLNVPFGEEPFGSVNWRGWAMRITPAGIMEPVCAGLRSPSGLECSPWGEFFYTDNQGEWCAANKLSVLREGSFHGHPHGIESAKLPESKVEYPGELPDGMLMAEAAQTIAGFQLPAVWFPYDKMGRSPSGMVWDRTDGGFGPFPGQLFVGDQYAASLQRVFLEQIEGRWQGACFPFRRSLGSGVIRVAFADSESLWVGLSDRGWPSVGKTTSGLERVRWTGKTPFEIREMQARPDGFHLVFTQPVDPTTAADPESYSLISYTYELHSDYGCDELDEQSLSITSLRVGDDSLTVDLTVSGLRECYVHELVAEGVRSAEGLPLLHPDAYYTLIRRPR